MPSIEWGDHLSDRILKLEAERDELRHQLALATAERDAAKELAYEQHLDRCDWVTALHLEDEQGRDQSDAATWNLFSAGWDAAVKDCAALLVRTV